jgi:hypothetical protein
MRIQTVEVMFLNDLWVVSASRRFTCMSKSKRKKRAEGLEQHKQKIRAKKMQRKQRKNASLPSSYRKGKK